MFGVSKKQKIQNNKKKKKEISLESDPIFSRIQIKFWRHAAKGN